MQFAPAQGYYLNILMQAATYAIAVIGIVVVLGYCGQISLAQAAFFGIGAYGVAFGTVDYGLNFFVALGIGVAGRRHASACSSASASLRLGGHYLGMVTISFQQISPWFSPTGSASRMGRTACRGVPRAVDLFGISFAGGDGLSRACLVSWCWSRCTPGVSNPAGSAGPCRRSATTNSPPAPAGSTCSAPRCISLRHQRRRSVASAAGCSPAAFSYISPDQFSFAESIVLLTMALLGGVQSPIGALFGTMLLIMLPEWLRFLRQVYLAVYGAAVILIMVFLPDGIWGWSTQRLRKHATRLAGVAPLPLLVAQGRGHGRAGAGNRRPGQAFRRTASAWMAWISPCAAAPCMP